MGEVTFRCPQCGATYTIPSERVPIHGARGPCKGCSTPLTVYPDGRVATPDSIPPPVAAATPRPSPPIVPTPPPPQSPQGVSVDFSCPSCGKSHRVPRERIPASGARGNCSGCGAGLFVAPDGRARLLEEPPKLSLQHPPTRESAPASPPGPQLIETAPTAAWEIQVDGQVLGPFPFGDIKHLVLADRLPPDRMVRPSGGDWRPASEFALLAALYAPHEKSGEPGQESFGGEDRCFRHPAVTPTNLCSQCQRYMCAACVKQLPTHDGRKNIPQCPVCGGPTSVLNRRTTWTPFYRDVGQALLAPLQSGHAILYFGLLAFLQACKVPCAVVPMIGFMAVIVLTIFQTTFYLHVVRAVGNGSYDIPEWPDIGNYMDMVFGFLKVLFVTVVALLPVIVLGCIGGAGLAGAAAGLMGGRGGDGAAMALLGPWIVLVMLLTLFYILYLPVCIAIVAVFDTVAPALNPVVIFKIIFRFGPTYLLAAALWLALIVINASTAAILGRAGVVGSLLHAPVEVYTSLVMAYILGRIVYENEERVGWY